MSSSSHLLSLPCFSASDCIPHMCSLLSGILAVQNAETECCRLGGTENNLFPAVVEAGRFSITKCLPESCFMICSWVLVFY